MTSATAKSLDERPAEVSIAHAPNLGSPLDMTEVYDVVDVAMRFFDEHLAMRAEQERHLHLPARIVGESAGDHLRRRAPEWTDMPDEPPLGEEGGTAWTPDNLWLREEAPRNISERAN
jgi:hypothetical protein